MAEAEHYLADASQISACLHTIQRPLVFTNGCFDILHLGHVNYLEQAAALGTSLVVGVNSDTSVRRQQKGSDRPVNPQHDRASIINALKVVTATVIFNEDTPITLIQTIVPDVLVKGADWPVDEIVGGAFVQQHGGRVQTIKFEHDRSTTKLIQRIRRFKT